MNFSKKYRSSWPIRFFRLCLVGAVAVSATGQDLEAQTAPAYTSPLPTGLRLDPVGELVDLGSMPLGMALAPDGKELVVVLSGWREQGFQVVDLRSRKVMQTVNQDAAFY
jgi:hypothetical protein